MTAPLSRDEACDAYLDERSQAGRSDVPITVGRAFRAGWSARDAEVERLRAAIEAALPAMQNAIRAGLQDFGEAETEAIVNEHFTIKQLKAALAGEGAK